LQRSAKSARPLKSSVIAIKNMEGGNLMSLNKTLRVAAKVARDIDRANQRAIRERERRERELERQRQRELREEERLAKQLEREEKKRKKEEEKAAFEKEKKIFEKRQADRREMRLEFINKVR